MMIQNKTSFGSIYDITSYVQNHTLINRGITTIGGSTVPQCVMSNNKDEALERATMGSIYFAASYLTPILLLPLYNKCFLRSHGITKGFNKIQEKIIQVPKRFLTPIGDLKKGLELTAESFNKKFKTSAYTDAFKEIYERYNNPAKLKKDLLKVHEKILMTDFITTAAMWAGLPWIATEMTEKRTKRKDFSGGFNLKEEDKTKNDEPSKKEKIIWNIAFSVIPGIVFSKALTKGLNLNPKTMKNTPLNGFLKKFTSNPDNFDYTSGTNMSKTIYASIWLLSSFPAKIISSRDKNERKDRTLRDLGLFTMFFGGDFLLNNILGRLSDKFLGTKIMNTEKYSGKNLNFLQNFKLPLKNFKTLDNLGLQKDVLKKTKTVGASLYWVSLLTNTALIGFVLPRLLNKMLRHNIAKENRTQFKDISLPQRIEELKKKLGKM